MAQPVYPTLSEKPEDENFVRQPAYDPVIRTEFENGIQSARARHTQVPLFWHFEYRQLSTSDRNTLMTFYEDSANYGAVVIKFLDPSDTENYFVRFRDRPQITLEPGGTNTWHVIVEFDQAIGSYT